nr:DUF6545 domain-containing protein [Rhodococcus wratislaviensis]GLK33961.1 hypothetical protein GCM10017611_08040 [Rhodococcus wratislaviensis]
MTSPVTGWIAWPIIILLLVVTLTRFRLLNRTPTDQLINQALSFAAAGMLLREQIVEDVLARYLGPFGDVDLLRQISFGFIVLIVQAIYGMAQLWAAGQRTGVEAAQVDEVAVWRRQWIYYGIGLASGLTVLVAGSPARNAGLLIDQYLGWPAVIAWLAFYAPILMCGALIVRVFSKEICAKDTTRRERLLYVLNVALAGALVIDSVVAPLTTLYEVVTATPTRDPQMTVKALTFFLATTGATAVVTVPTVAVVMSRLGWDRTGRSIRRLHLLWQDLTDAFPDVRTARAENPPRQLHRMIIEIHDALLRLRRFVAPAAQDDIDYVAATHTDEDRRKQLLAGLQIARALEAKLSALAPHDGGVRLQFLNLRPREQHLTATSDQLIALADDWPTVRHYVETYVQGPSATTGPAS